jgi:hypothetical protein
VQTKKFVTIVVTLVVLVGIIGGALFGGIAIGKNKSSTSTTQQFGGGTGQFPGGGNSSAYNRSAAGLGIGGGTTGTVSGISGDVITLTTTNGSVVQVYTNSSTRIEEVTATTLSLSDITTGENISVTGRRSQSGTVNATSIIIGSFQMADFQMQSLP